MRHFRRAGALAAGALLFASPAHATPPSVTTETLPRHFEFPGACGDFGVNADFIVTRRTTTFYDNGGNVTHSLVHASGTGTNSNSVTGKSVEAIFSRTITLDADGNFVRSTGSETHIVVPGMGTVRIGAGLFEPDDQHGRFDPAVTAALCEALA